MQRAAAASSRVDLDTGIDPYPFRPGNPYSAEALAAASEGSPIADADEGPSAEATPEPSDGALEPTEIGTPQEQDDATKASRAYELEHAESGRSSGNRCSVSSI